MNIIGNLICQKEQNHFLKVANALDLNFVSVDIIELFTGEILVLEANSGVMIENFIKLIPDGKKIAKNIYTKAIDEMFK